jgi:hypothetical protein
MGPKMLHGGHPAQVTKKKKTKESQQHKKRPGLEISIYIDARKKGIRSRFNTVTGTCS